MSTILIGADALESFVCDLFVAAGLPQEWAQAEAEILVWADLRGVGSHGVLRIPSYLSWMPRGLRKADADIRTIKDKGVIGVLEADRGPGLYVARRAMDMAIEKARAHGIGFVWVRQGTHTGAIGYYARRAAEAGMVGMTMCSSRPLMAYFGSRDAVLGTSPIAIGVPRANGTPIVFDMAAAATTIGAMAQARQSGKPLPHGVALDAQGHVTTDPYKAETPLPIAGPKGSGLGFMIECLCSLLTGFPLVASALEDPSLRNEFLLNTLCIAIDPEALDVAASFGKEVDRLARDIASLPRADGVSEILMPGQRGDRVMAQRRRDGIPIPEGIWKQLATEAQKRGVAVPAAASSS